MKKVLFCILTCFSLLLCGCDFFADDEIIKSLGECKSKELYTHGGFQDYTDYSIYKFEGLNLSDNEYFKNINTEAIGVISGCIENFESIVGSMPENDNLKKNYCFDINIISENDYYYISENSQNEIYSVYLIDTETETLYYFHNNI